MADPGGLPVCRFSVDANSIACPICHADSNAVSIAGAHPNGNTRDRGSTPKDDRPG